MGMPHFFGKLSMAASTPPFKNRSWLVIFGLMTIVICIVMAILAYLFFMLRISAEPATPTVTVTREPAFALPTSSNPTITPGPLSPQEIKFMPVEPIQGFSSCDSYGVKGMVTARNGTRLQGVQIVVWQDQTEFLALGATDTEGNYAIEITGEPALRQLSVQVYENDLPISEPVLIETQIDCQIGFQIYQIDWQHIKE